MSDDRFARREPCGKLDDELAVFDASRLEVLANDDELWDAARDGFRMRPAVATLSLTRDEVKLAARAMLERLGPCDCDEPDGACEGCDDEHGHTCRACDEEWCQACWQGAAHHETCPRSTRRERAG